MVEGPPVNSTDPAPVTLEAAVTVKFEPPKLSVDPAATLNFPALEPPPSKLSVPLLRFAVPLSLNATPVKVNVPPPAATLNVPPLVKEGAVPPPVRLMPPDEEFQVPVE